MTTVPAAAVPAAVPSASPLQARYDPLAGEARRSNPDWLRRNTGAWANPNTGDGTPGQGQEIDPRYRERDYSFRDVLESFNPIQHVPVVGQLYRDATGTQLHPIARIAGGAASGPLGGVSAFANVALENATGRDLAGHVLNIVAPRPGNASGANVNGPQVAGGSWVYDASIGQSAPGPGGADPIANMAAAPTQAVDPAAADRAAPRAQRRPAARVAPPPPAPPAQALAMATETLAPAGRPAAGAVIQRPAPLPAAADNRAPAQPIPPGNAVAQVLNVQQMQPGSPVAQALTAQGAPAAQNAQGRNIQQYFVLAGSRPPGPESARAVPLSPPAGSTVRLGQAVTANGSEAPAAPGARAPQQGAPPDATPGVGATDRGWFTAAMLRGVDRYRDTRRSQDGEQRTVDLSE